MNAHRHAIFSTLLAAAIGAASVCLPGTAQAAAGLPMGAYLQNPGLPGSADEASFNSHYSQFTAAMQAAPQFLDTYIDERQPQHLWPQNAGWLAYVLQSSANARSMTQVVGIPLFTTYAGRGQAPDLQLQAMAAGRHDFALNGIVDQLTTSRTPGFAGFKTIYFRLGWEMNLFGTWYAGQDATTIRDWVAAFRHAATLIRARAATHGAHAIIVWNPGVTVWGIRHAANVFYPGDAYVDVVAADFYADINPANNGGTPVTWENWDAATSPDGQPWEDPNYADIILDPVNRAHFWTYPTGDAWSPEGDTSGYTLSFLDLLHFAQSRGKPFGVAETGAGGAAPNNDVADDGAFPIWLGTQLAAAQSSGTPIAFVNLWDSNGTAPYLFSDGSKPQQLAGFAHWFGGAP